MKRHTTWIALLTIFTLLLGPAAAPAADTAKSTPTATQPSDEDQSPAAPYARTLAAVTGVAISPLLGTAALGAWQRLKAETVEEKANLPWYAQWSFILPALLLVAAVATKDVLGATPGFEALKKPLDVLETVENKASGLVAAGAVVPFTMASLSKMIIASAPASSSPTPLLAPSGTATILIGTFDWSALLNLLTVPLGIAVFALVWLASHAINALILLSPWGMIDAALKGARTTLLALIPLVATLNPWVSLALSALLVLTAYLVAGWAFRLTVFGAVFSWDFFTLRKRRFHVAENGDNPVFSSNTLTKQGVPMRTYGKLRHEPENGRLVFHYRPWLVLPEKSIQVKLNDAYVGKGLFFSTIRDGDLTAFVLPPRYRGHEEALARACALEGGVHDAGLLKAWGALRELFGGSAARASVA